MRPNIEGCTELSCPYHGPELRVIHEKAHELNEMFYTAHRLLNEGRTDEGLALHQELAHQLEEVDAQTLAFYESLPERRDI